MEANCHSSLMPVGKLSSLTVGAQRHQRRDSVYGHGAARRQMMGYSDVPVLSARPSLVFSHRIDKTGARARLSLLALWRAETERPETATVCPCVTEWIGLSVERERGGRAASMFVCPSTGSINIIGFRHRWEQASWSPKQSSRLFFFLLFHSLSLSFCSLFQHPPIIL